MIDTLTHPILISTVVAGAFLIGALFWAMHEEEKDKSKTDKND